MVARSVAGGEVANTTGMVSPVASPIMRSGPCVLFQMIAAEAPAAWALRALTAKPQPPRCTSAMLPAGKPA